MVVIAGTLPVRYIAASLRSPSYETLTRRGARESMLGITGCLGQAQRCPIRTEPESIIALDRVTQRVTSFASRARNFGRRNCDTAFYALAFRLASIRRGRAASALVFPEPIRPVYTIWKTCMLLGLRIVPAAEMPPPDVAVFWEDTTESTPPTHAPNSVNARCTDIGKDVVERHFAAVFGYPLAIDTTTHQGPYVRKSRDNFAHDGAIRSGPVDARERRYVYERLIDNSIDEGWQVMDMRTAVVGARIPVVFLLFRSITDRFGTDSRRGVVVSPDAVFSASEQDQILGLARAMGLDFGELDVLRDAGDGRIYIVDVNKTPTGPPRPLSLGDRHRAMRLVANAFAAEFLDRSLVGDRDASAKTSARD